MKLTVWYRTVFLESETATKKGDVTLDVVDQLRKDPYNGLVEK